MSLIHIEHLRKEYSGVTPLKDVCADINQGDVISIIGPSGTGKSTLLRCLNRLEDPSSGKIIVDGEDITDPNCKLPLVRRKMGMVFQSFYLFNNLNIIENVTYAPIHLLKIPKNQAYQEGMKLLERVGLAEKAENFPEELSGGQKQRIAIARAIAMKPKILLFDEPTSALDPTMVSEVLRVIRGLADEGMTMMIVTHEMNFARDISNRVFYMDEGGIYEEGSPEQIFKNPQKEKTKQFIQRLRRLTLTITDPDPHYPEFLQQMEQFGRNAMISVKTLQHIILVLEELVIQNILPAISVDRDTFPIVVDIEYSGTKGETNIEITYGGKEYNVLTQGDELSMMIVKKMVAKIRYEKKDRNHISVML